MKPLFIPLKTQYYDAFLNGSKNTEYRPYILRWSEDVCCIGRRVVISKGYGVKHRRTGVIIDYDVILNPVKSVPGWKEIYGDEYWSAAAIKIQLDPITISFWESGWRRKFEAYSAAFKMAHERKVRFPYPEQMLVADWRLHLAVERKRKAQ